MKTLRSVLADPTSALGALIRRANEHKRRAAALRTSLDVPGAESLRVAAVEGDTLIVTVDSAARCARLRFQAPRIVAHAARVLDRPELRRLEVRVRPA